MLTLDAGSGARAAAMAVVGPTPGVATWPAVHATAMAIACESFPRGVPRLRGSVHEQSVLPRSRCCGAAAAQSGGAAETEPAGRARIARSAQRVQYHRSARF